MVLIQSGGVHSMPTSRTASETFLRPHEALALLQRSRLTHLRMKSKGAAELSGNSSASTGLWSHRLWG